MLQTVDTLWKDHLLGLDHLKEGIGLRGYGQRDPLVEYKKESFQLFEAMKEGIEEQILQYLFRFEVAAGARPSARRATERRRRAREPADARRAGDDGLGLLAPRRRRARKKRAPEGAESEATRAPSTRRRAATSTSPP